MPGLKAKHRSESNTFSFTTPGNTLRDTSEEDRSITVILNAYRRTQYLPMQIDALRKQTLAPIEIWLWCNDADNSFQDFSSLVDRILISNTNWKFWGRFTLGAMARSKYIAFFDDDILPQPRWLEHCANTIDQVDGILGGSGVILPKEGGYSSKHKVGWNGYHYDSVHEVDLVGHAWFLKKEHLQYMWREEPASWENGEDIHLSSCALRYGGVKTYVPAHPEKDPELWSCRPDFGKRVAKVAATHKSEGHHTIRSMMVDQYRKNGWEIVAEKSTG